MRQLEKGVFPERIGGNFRNSIEYSRDKQPNQIRHKKYKSQFTNSKHKSIYSLGIQSNLIINDLDFHPPRMLAQQFKIVNDDSPLSDSRKAPQQTIPKEIKVQRYMQNDKSMDKKWDQLDEQYEHQRQNRQKISLLKRIIQHYNIKSIEDNYYSNLVNNIAVKGSVISNSNHRFITIKTKSTLYQPQQRMSRHERSLKIKRSKKKNAVVYQDFFNNSLIRVEAQSIKHFNKNESSQKDRLVQIREDKAKTSKNLRKTNYAFVRSIKKDLFMNENSTSLKFYQNGQNCINIKVNKYKEFIFIVNYSNNIYRELDIQKYQTPFKIFVGYGNNSNLIKAIIKKRFWLQITKNKQEANILWTQLKDDSVYIRQSSQMENSQNQSAHNYNRHHSRIFSRNSQKQPTSSTYGLENSSDSQCFQGKFEAKLQQTSKQDQVGSLKVNMKQIEIFNPFSRILTPEQAKSYLEMMSQITYKKRTKFKDRLKYMKYMSYRSQEDLSLSVIQNHLPLNGILGNKKAMYYMMKQYCRLVNKNIFQMVPLTFHIKKGLMDEQFKEFIQYYNSNRQSKKPNYWIMKPGQFSNRGQGISCTSKVEQVRSKINNLKKAGKNKSLILQQYITNPLLYNGRKFDIRTYMLISINNGKLRAYWYQEGYIRTSSYQWRLDEISDTLIHLTNDAIQKYSNDYGKFEPANKLTYSQLQRYLDTLPKTSVLKYNFHKEVYPKLREIATDAVKATFKFIDPLRRGNNFQIFGFDFMIDNNFKPWLIEINTNPCLEVNCLPLQKIIPSMIENAFRIAVDSIFPPPLNYSSTYKYNIPQNALHYNRFQLIFDEERDGLALLQLYRDSRIVQSIDDYEEDKDIYEQQGQEIDIQ